jgi:hypothetical protein
MKNDRVLEGTYLHKGRRNDYKDRHECQGDFYLMLRTWSFNPALDREGRHSIPDGIA